MLNSSIYHIYFSLLFFLLLNKKRTFIEWIECSELLIGVQCGKLPALLITSRFIGNDYRWSIDSQDRNSVNWRRREKERKRGTIIACREQTYRGGVNCNGRSIDYYFFVPRLHAGYYFHCSFQLYGRLYLQK